MFNDILKTIYKSLIRTGDESGKNTELMSRIKFNQTHMKAATIYNFRSSKTQFSIQNDRNVNIITPQTGSANHKLLNTSYQYQAILR